MHVYIHKARERDRTDAMSEFVNDLGEDAHDGRQPTDQILDDLRPN